MNKPDWKDAPKDMKWLAQDLDGSWWWYMDKPDQTACGWIPVKVPNRHQVACQGTLNSRISSWEQTLERRP